MAASELVRQGSSQTNCPLTPGGIRPAKTMFLQRGGRLKTCAPPRCHFNSSLARDFIAERPRVEGIGPTTRLDEL